ncbi:MAG: hypothetical protein WCJ19_00825 [bacterium]
MNKKIAYTWIILILGGFIFTDLVQNFLALAILWSIILIIGCGVMVLYGWKQDKYLCIYWIITLLLGTILSALQFLSIDNNNKLLPIQHISTIWIIIIGFNFVVTTIISKIIYFAPLGLVMLCTSLLIDNFIFSFPGTTFGIILSIVMMGYVALSFLTPMDPINLGERYSEVNGEDEEKLTHMHKFKCSNCGYIYEGHEKINYCPRCMAGADMLVDAG